VSRRRKKLALREVPDPRRVDPGPSRVLESLAAAAALRDQTASKADCNRVRPASRLQLRQEVTDVGLHRLLGQEQPLPDLPVDEAVRDELQHLELAGGRLLLELTQDGRCERNHGAGAGTAATRSRRFEAAAVVTITAEDLLTLRGVHESGIGLPRGAL
jgi:hypothetical protein